MKFVFEDLLPRDDVSTGRAIDETPSAVGLESSELLVHGYVPVGVPESGTG